MKLRILFLLGLLLSLFLVSCKHEEEKDAITPCGKKNISYVADIKPIISKNCKACHQEYLVYDKLNAACEDGSFFKRVIYLHDMPPSGMDTCDLITLRRWYYNGHTPY
jgi:hypothetical protein